MDALKIERTYRTPGIILDHDNGIIELIGVAIIDNHDEFYEEFINQIDVYCNNPKEQTKLKIDLDYIDTRSSKYLIKILKKLDFSLQKKQLSINWYCDKDDDNIEKINIIKETIKININVIEKD